MFHEKAIKFSLLPILDCAAFLVQQNAKKPGAYPTCLVATLVAALNACFLDLMCIDWRNGVQRCKLELGKHSHIHYTHTHLAQFRFSFFGSTRIMRVQLRGANKSITTLNFDAATSYALSREIKEWIHEEHGPPPCCVYVLHKGRSLDDGVDLDLSTEHEPLIIRWGVNFHSTASQPLIPKTMSWTCSLL